ncbi:MAG: CoA transferase [Coriobacteriales bacterium]|nr:CoA transferase [Coriobacteriaceae bacterium]MDY2723966.1 CoA transferase [Coriobacteriales bacterium]
MEDVKRPLEGIKVVEMATFIAVPAVGRILADLGAEVIKIESAKGDNLRYTAPNEGRPSDPHEDINFDLENGGKKGIVVDLRTDKGREVLFKLLDDADVFLTNWRPQALARKNLTYDDLKERYPSLVYASLTGYGEKGPDKDLPGFDYTAFFARSGWSGSLYQKGTVPSNLIPALGDHQGALALTVGVLAALFRAKTTGMGEKVSTNLLHTAVWVQSFQIQGAQYGNEFGGVSYPFDRRDNQLPYQPAVQTKDGRFLQVMGPNFGIYYSLIMKAIGREDVLDDPVLSDQKEMIRTGRVGEAYDIIQEGFKQKTAAEWAPILTELDIPFALCKTYEEVVADEQAWANDVFCEVDYPRGPKAMVRTPIDLEETPLPEYEKAPLLGADTVSVLEGLGYEQSEIQAMIDDKTVGIWEEK